MVSVHVEKERMKGGNIEKRQNEGMNRRLVPNDITMEEGLDL